MPAPLAATRFGFFALVVALGTAASHAAPVTLPYTEDFQRPAPSADATVDYPDFTYDLGGGTATVDAGGVLHLTPGGADQLATVTPTTDPAGNNVIISADISATDSNGSYNVGLVVAADDGTSQSRVVFHPGYPEGALRVDGTGGFGNTNVGFTPSNNTLHNLKLVSHSDGLFEITLTSGDDPSKSFSTTFTNPAAYGGQVGFVRAGNRGDGLYDNLSITVVPEPASLSLFGVSALLLARRRRNVH